METFLIILLVASVIVVFIIINEKKKQEEFFLQTYEAYKRSKVGNTRPLDQKYKYEDNSAKNPHLSIRYICSAFQNQLQEIIELDKYPSFQTHIISGVGVINGEHVYKFRPLARFDDDWSVGYIAGLADGYCQYNKMVGIGSDGSGQGELEGLAIMTVVFSRIYGDEDGPKNFKRFLLGQAGVNDQISAGMKEGGQEMTSHLLDRRYIPNGWVRHVKE